MRCHQARALWALTLSACLSPRIVSLEPAKVPPSPSGTPEAQLDVVGQVSGGADPMPVHGDWMAFSNVAVALGRFVSASTQPWVARNRDRRPGGWQLLVELTRSRADLRDQRLTVELEARVTLKANVGQLHLAQTTGHCIDIAPMTPDRPAQAVYQCMERMARDLAGWIEGTDP